MDMAKKTLILASEEKHFSFRNFFFTSDTSLKPKVEQNHGVHFFAHENYGGIRATAPTFFFLHHSSNNVAALLLKTTISR